ncbi:hypothetical protein TNCV_2822451 [Trichonephila clavipes]|nr:hypothetical protein TNCV_2822451 [Trichonephila clavipes]
MSLNSGYSTSAGGSEYGIKLKKSGIMHAKLELYKGMVAQSWSGGAFSWYCLGSLGRVPTTLNAIRYIELLGDHLNPFMLFCYPHDSGVFFPARQLYLSQIPVGKWLVGFL